MNILFSLDNFLYNYCTVLVDELIFDDRLGWLNSCIFRKE